MLRLRRKKDPSAVPTPYTWRKIVFRHWMPSLLIGAAAALALSAVAGFFLVQRIVVLSRLLDASSVQIPSRIYSAEYTIQTGASCPAEELRRRLDRLQYTPSEDVTQSGRYRRQENRLTVFLRDAPTSNGLREGYPVRIEWDESLVARITNLETGREEKEAVLEPELLGTIYDAAMEDRYPIALSDVSPRLIDCLLLTEDQTFFEHSGFDPVGMMRASWANVQEKRLAQGASTLTQQLVRDLFLSRERTFQRKLDEILLSLLVENTYSKQEILAWYINNCYLGQDGPVNLRGVRQGARGYFNTDPRHLTLAQSALLVSILRGPNLYNPAKAPDRVKERRDWILARMGETGKATPDDVNRALQEPLPAERHTLRKEQLFFVNSVVSTLSSRFGEEALKTQGYHIFTDLDMTIQEEAEASVLSGLEKLEAEHPDLKQAEEPLEAALLCLDAETGAVRAMVGGRTLRSNPRNRALWARRPIGSLIKPFFYLYALKESQDGRLEYDPTTRLDDSPFTLETDSGRWSPENYTRRYSGPVTMRKALENSINIPVIRLAQQIGLSSFKTFFQQLGLEHFEAVPSAPLGTTALTPFEAARLYTLFLNQGRLRTPCIVRTVCRQDGQPVYSHPEETVTAAPPESTYQVLSFLEGVMERGTAKSAREMGWKGYAAGKTGSTNSLQDSWFAGMTPKTLTLVWVGYDMPKNTGLSGREAALPLWVEFMTRLYPEGNRVPFPIPAGVQFQYVNYDSGEAAGGEGGPAVVECFLARSRKKVVVSSPAASVISSTSRTEKPSPTVPKSIPTPTPQAVPSPTPKKTPTPKTVAPGRSKESREKVDTFVDSIFPE